MTTRYKGFYVALEQDIREDDLQGLLDAVGRMRHVAGVSAEQCAATFSDWSNRQQLRHEVYMKLSETLYEAITGEPHPLKKRATTS